MVRRWAMPGNFNGFPIDTQLACGVMHTGFHTIQKVYSAEGVRGENVMPESNNALTLGAIFYNRFELLDV